MTTLEKTTRITILATTVMVLAAFGAATGFAASVDPPNASAATLRAAKAKLAWEAQKTKGAPSQRLRMQELKLDRLLEDLEAGRKVDPREIDRLLDEAN